MRSFQCIFLLALCSILPAPAQQFDDWRIGELSEIISLVVDGSYREASGKIDVLLPRMEGMEDEAFAIIYRMQGLSYQYLRDADSAENALLKAWLYAGNLDDSRGIKRAIASDIGQLYSDLKNYGDAERFLLIAKRLYEANLDMGLQYAIVLYRLGAIANQGDYSFKAKIYFDTAVDILRDLGPEYDNDRAKMLGAIAVVCGRMGYLEEASQIVVEAKSIAERLSDEGLMLEINSYMALVYEIHGNWEEAASCYEQIHKSGSPNDIDASWYLALARATFLAGDRAYSKAAIEASREIQQDVISKFAFLTEAERLLYWDYYMPHITVLNAMLAAVDSKENNIAVLNNALFSKGLLLRTSTFISECIRNALDETDRAKMTERDSLKAQLDNGNLHTDSAEWCHNRVLMIEKELLRANVSYSTLFGNLLADWKTISESLNKDEVAIEFAPISAITTELPYGGEEESYIAVILTKNCKCPVIVPVCGEGDVKRLTDNRSRLSNSKFINNLYSSDSQRSKGEELYELVWKPLDSYVSKAKTIYYSPIGALSSVSFNAISHEGRFLCERYNMRMVSTIAEVIRLKTTGEQMPGSAVVYGGIVYDVDSSTLLANARGYDHDRGGSVGEDDQERSGWHYLSSTADEAWGVQQRLESSGVSTSLYMGDSANEESFKAFTGQSPDIVHLATHGFFLSDPKQIETNPFLNGLGDRATRHNYLNRSGLLFAGGNRAWTGEDMVEGIDDGILTAEEVSRLDLSNTDVVVLSACETGLGVNVSSEGVFGLQRAFKLAGVETLIMSLWSVSDATTSELMLLFYDNWMGGMERHEAFYAAQDSIRERYHEPYRWAGFVMMD